MGGPGIDQQRGLHLLFHHLGTEQHSAIDDSFIPGGNLLQLRNIVARAVDVQPGVRQIGQLKTFHQIRQAIFPADPSGVQTHPGLFFPGKIRFFLLHGDVRVSFQNHIGFSLRIQGVVHGLGQQHIGSTVGYDKIGYLLGKAASRQQIRHVGNDTHARPAPESGRQQGRQGCHPVQHVHHHGGVPAPQSQHLEKSAQSNHNGLGQGISDGRQIPVDRAAFLLPGQKNHSLAQNLSVYRGIGNHVHLCPSRQALNQQAMILLGLKGRLHRHMLKQPPVGLVRAGGHRI